jgi:alkyldihydroxyacetonephosphate synthase
VENGGTISHQHGVGSDHAPYLAAEKGELGISAMRALFAHFDPEHMMNPGKLLPWQPARALARTVCAPVGSWW